MSADRRVPPGSPGAKPRRSAFATSISIGHVAGIDIRVHVTFLLLVALVALTTSRPGGLGVASSLVWLVLIFACVVVHELAHSLVARRRGAVVHEIVLLPIGGVSKLERLPESPPDELAVAIAGPAASVGLAAAGAVLGTAFRQPLLPVDLYGGPLLARLVWFNLIIAGFNLLPAFPLDGGRVFRALLERRYDLARATQLAARVGRALALTLVALGVFVNLWFLIIGVFVYFGAAAEEAATVVHMRLRGLRVADVMLREPLVVDPAMTAAELRILERRSAQRAFPVVGPRGYEGMLDAAAIEHSSSEAVAIDLAKPVPVLSLMSNLEDEALPQVISSPVRAVAVVEHGRIVGLLRLEDVEHLISDTGHNRARFR